MANTIKHKRGSGSDPSASDLVAGELAIRTDNGAVFTKKDDGTVVQVTGASVGGATGVDFNDNVKARFGDGNDLEIYHDGSNSYIKETAGTGNLRIEANDLRLKNGAGNEDYIKCNENAQVELYYNGAKKLETKSDGIDVTGEVQCDSLDVDGAAVISGTMNVDGGTLYVDSANNRIGVGTSGPSTKLEINGGTDNNIVRIVSTDANANIEFADNTTTSGCQIGANGDNLKFGISGTERMRIDSDGRLLIGLSSSLLSYAGLQVKGDADTGGHICLAHKTTAPVSGNNIGSVRYTNSAGGIGAIIGVEADANWTAGSSFPTRIILATTASSASSPTERMRIDSSGDVTLQGNLGLEDNKKILLGASDDLQIYHSGSNSFIKDAGTGRLKILTDYLDVENAAATENIIHATADGSVELYHNGSKKLETKSDGVDITGELQCDSLDVDGVADISGHVTLHGNLDLQDNDRILVGTGDDLRIYHDGTHSRVENHTNALILQNQADDQDIILQTDNGSGGTADYIRCDGSDGKVRLYHYGTQKFQTESGGIDVTGTVKCDALDVDGAADITGNVTLHANLDLQDNDLIRLGSGDDLQIFHSGANSHVETSTSSTGDLYVISQGTNHDLYLQAADDIFIRPQGGENGIVCTGNGGVFLYYDASQKLATKSDGIDVTGEVQCDSLDVDGGADIAGQLDVHRLIVRDNGSSSPVFAIRTDDDAPWAFVLGNDTYSSSNTHGLRIYQGSDGTIHARNSGNSNWEGIKIAQQNGGTTNTGIELTTNREAKLYYQGSNKLTTKSDGVDITGELQCDSLDVDGAGDFTGDVTFRGGASAVNIAANSDIRLVSGNWTGNTTSPKIQAHSDTLYIVGGSNGIAFRENATDRAYIDNNGHFIPGTDDTYDLGRSDRQWRDGFFDGEVNCDGIAVDGTSEFTDVINLANDKAIAWGGGSNRPAWVGNKTSGYLTANIGGVERLRINSNGAWGIEGASNYGSSGQVLTSNGNDAPTWQDAGGGKILQVVGSTQMSTGQTTSSSTLLYNSTTVSITPSSSSSKILFIYSQGIQVDVDNDGSGSNNGLVQYEYKIGSGSYTEFENHRISARGGNNMSSTDILTVSPNTTSTVTFRIGIRKHEGGRIIAFTNVFGANKVTLMEIGA